MKRKNGFTLIELLAIIVILAIIAVITVPIILGIIDDAQMNAAKDSAYGFKDSVNKYYAQQLLNNQNLKLNDTYTVTNGTLSGGSFGDSTVTSFPIQLSGTVPSSGELTYENNVLTNGCLVIGEYAVTFDGGSVSSTTKGNCSPTFLSMDEMCPGCVFAYTLDELILGTSTVPANVTSNYTTLTNEHPYFLGFIANSNTNVIERAFACGVENGTPFCLEGYDASKYADNVGVLNTIFPTCETNAPYSSAGCDGSSVGAGANGHGYVSVGVINGHCVVNNNGAVYCYE